MTDAPLRYQFLYRNAKVGSADDLARPDFDRFWSNLGWSLERGEALPDVDRCCSTCGATWVGPRDESCQWCEHRHAALIAGQRTLVLCEPDIDVLDAHDKEIKRAADAWSARLAVAVEARLVTTTEADEAVKAWLEKVTRWRNP